MRRPTRWLRLILPPLTLLTALFVGWEVSVLVFEVPGYLLPAPSDIAGTALANVSFIVQSTGATLAAIVVGFALSLSAGLLLGVVIFYSPLLQRALYPLLIASRNVPLFAIAPLLVVWLGFGLPPKVAVAVIIAFFPIVVNTYDGLRSVDTDLITLMRTMRANRWQILAKVRLPGALPFVLSGVKLGLVYSVLGAVFAEMVVGGQVWRASGNAAAGLGYWIRNAASFGDLDLAFALVAWLAILSLALFGLLVLLERRLLRWQRTEQTEAA